ncbi:mannonate dehydratase [Candidatus Latescibacterota bacterium]
MKEKSGSRRRFLKRAAGAASLACMTSFNSSRCRAAGEKAEWNPKISENIGSLDDSTLRWMAQIGLKHVVLQDNGQNIDRDGKKFWTVKDIQVAQQKCAEFGLELTSTIIPIQWYRKNSLGEPGRDEEIDRIVRSIKAAGSAGISMLEWRPTWLDFYWDERVGYFTAPGRGGAGYKSFDYNRVKNLKDFDEFPHVTPDEMWDRFFYLARPVVEAADETGTMLSIHPNDPPVSVMRGAPRIFTSMADAERIISEFPSPVNGITFCQGTFTEMGVDVIEAIQTLGTRIHHIHLRGVRDKVPYYEEVFIDEGDVDMFEAMKAYKEIGYTGTIVSDHTPQVEGGGRVGRSFSHGYIRAMVQAVNSAT